MCFFWLDVQKIVCFPVVCLEQEKAFLGDEFKFTCGNFLFGGNFLQNGDEGMILLQAVLIAGVWGDGSVSRRIGLIGHDNWLVLDVLILVLHCIVGEKIDPRSVVGIEEVLTGWWVLVVVEDWVHGEGKDPRLNDQ